VVQAKIEGCRFSFVHEAQSATLRNVAVGINLRDAHMDVLASKLERLLHRMMESLRAR
jgi:hypothetical protein